MIRGVEACVIAALLVVPAAAAPRPDAMADGYITGRVVSEDGPEAGVWVIAETEELKTPLIKIVVTDDEGRFTLPELPEATYWVWVRGYGLTDSEAIEGRPGDRDITLEATVAATEAEAAQVYPADYWYSLYEPPAEDQFPGTGPSGNGVSPQMTSQKEWLNNQKSACNFCHQLGNEITRTLDHMDHLNFASSEEAWGYRTQLGVRGNSMAGAFATFGREAAMRTFADWTDRIAAGELPPVPERPQGIERNVVVTLWDWGVDTSFMHDEIATDKNDPTVNAWGPVYAVSSGHGKLTVLDPVDNSTYELIIPTREDPREVSSRFPQPGMPSNFWGYEHLWGPEHPSDPHNPMLDRKGRVWLTTKIRNDQPDWCRGGSNNDYAEYYPLNFSARQAGYYDPDTEEFVLIDTCFSTHHLQFDNDPDQTVYFNELLGPIVGWINTREFDRTRDEQASQGWCPQIIDTNGDGRITRPWNE
ncbi:MAG: carboxypeptidase-like regulatory domain-containing protein, partial [Gammaproteobacteria bacterium]|nr:carboxypeptidase-like regulatory domain-containing protein [Gammaproteobacteria bacterium]